MQPRSEHRWPIFFIVGIVVSFMVLSIVLPITAQGTAFATNTPAAENDAAPLFATNTPPGTVVAPMVDFATNTPEGGIPTETPEPTLTPTGPLADLFNYSLRIWLEQDLIEVAYEQVLAIQDGVRDADLALQLTLYELERRFPGAPHRSEQRAWLIDAMLQAPAGSIDMRSMVRPLIEEGVNQQADTGNFIHQGFEVSLTPLNLDNEGSNDALVHILYTDEEGSILYDDYVLAQQDENGGYRFLEATYDLYAAPFGGIQISLMDASDVNRDVRDEVVLRVTDNQVNDRMVILAFRNDRAVELAQPGTEIRFGEVVSWPYDNPDVSDPELSLITLQAESNAPNWPCNSAQEFTWVYDRNFYRPTSELNSRFVYEDSLGCALYTAEPLFAMAPADAVTLIENALLEYGFDAPGGDRALLTLGMLYILQGRLDDARTTAQSIIDLEDAQPWATNQASAMIEAMGISSNTALAICEAVSLAAGNPVCDMNAVLGRYLSLLELSANEDLSQQLEQAGLPVFDTVQISEVGKADRTAISFFLANTGWWGFYEQTNGLYSVEPAAAPEGFAAATQPEGQVSIPDSAFDALFVDNDPANALQILGSLETANPDRPFRPEGLYLRALSYDLTASREDARVAFYRIWERYPTSIWGNLAARHIEQR